MEGDTHELNYFPINGDITQNCCSSNYLYVFPVMSLTCTVYYTFTMTLGIPV